MGEAARVCGKGRKHLNLAAKNTWRVIDSILTIQ
jgi:hypothetical protein